MIVLLIALGGALGSISRYGLSVAVQRAAHTGFPAGTLAVNVLGSLLVGILAKTFMSAQTHPELRALLIAGFCGGFTTFSAFSLETVGLVQGGEWARAVAYVGSSMVLCLAATAIGFAIARSV